MRAIQPCLSWLYIALSLLLIISRIISAVCTRLFRLFIVVIPFTSYFLGGLVRVLFNRCLGYCERKKETDQEEAYHPNHCKSKVPRSFIDSGEN